MSPGVLPRASPKLGVSEGVSHGVVFSGLLSVSAEMRGFANPVLDSFSESSRTQNLVWFTGGTPEDNSQRTWLGSFFGDFSGRLCPQTLKTLTSLNKEVWPFFLGDNSIWSFPSVSSLSDYSIWRS